jgi:hypothetical protein
LSQAQPAQTSQSIETDVEITWIVEVKEPYELVVEAKLVIPAALDETFAAYLLICTCEVLAQNPNVQVESLNKYGVWRMGVSRTGWEWMRK